jgi:hypothetical protein
MTDVIPDGFKGKLSINESLDTRMAERMCAGPAYLPPALRRYFATVVETAPLVIGDRGASTRKNTWRSWVSGLPERRYTIKASATTLPAGSCPVSGFALGDLQPLAFAVDVVESQLGNSMRHVDHRSPTEEEWRNRVVPARSADPLLRAYGALRPR